MVMDLADLKINPARLQEAFDQLAVIGATVDGGVSRLALSNEDLEARAWLADQFEQVGLMVRDDDAGNLSGILPSGNPDARTLLIGSHMDSVPNGGRYDSSVGILAGLECLQTIRERGISLPFHLEAIDFTDEEGCWQSLFGSRAITGHIDKSFASEHSVNYGSFRAALFRAGIRPSDVHKAKRNPDDLFGYLELHIEQGYRLHSQGATIGIVSGIVGRTTYQLTFYGEASHSGTTAMKDRHDALLGASDYICASYYLAREHFSEGVYNCGNLEVSPGAFNIIPDKAVLTMECRHADKGRLEDMESALIRLAREKASHHGISVNVQRVQHMPAAVMSVNAVNATERACQHLGLDYLHLISYAGHDAQMFSDFTPTGMIFIPSVNGISHSPREFTEWQHIVDGTNALLHTILDLGQ